MHIRFLNPRNEYHPSPSVQPPPTMSPSTYTSTILITGGTTGLGYHAALTLASQLPTVLVILASRSDPNASASTINTKLSQQNVQYMSLDLGSLASVRDFCSRWSKANFPPISALLLNAGIQLPGDLDFTPDGIEKHFGVNHVGHALLFHLLVPCLTPDARIIITSSGLHDPDCVKEWGPLIVPAYATPDVAAAGTGAERHGRDRYATSKAANVIWTFALSSHLQSSQHTILAFDPGLMPGTSFTRDASWPVRFLGRWVLPYLIPVMRLLVSGNVNTPKESGGNLAWLVTSGETKGIKGRYYEKRKQREASGQARDEAVQADLWRWTVEKIGKDDEERKKFERVESRQI
jgi:NAD(P)-dependent dehydrogenase (short-subunit alcohol dehydrogenase family)